MIVIMFGQWNGSYGSIFSFKRIYWKGRRTPFCRMKFRFSHYHIVGFNGDRNDLLDFTLTGKLPDKIQKQIDE